jgi:hypothetical protein
MIFEFDVRVVTMLLRLFLSSGRGGGGIVEPSVVSCNIVTEIRVGV